MLRTVATVVAAIACLAAASPSRAQSFSPPWGTLGGSGTVTLTQSLTVTCDITAPFFNVMTPTYLSIPAHSLNPGDFLCGIWVTTDGIWTAAVVPGSTTTIQLTLGFAQISPCYGTIIAQWDNATNTATFTNAYLFGSTSCTVDGSITVPGLTII